MYKAHIQEAAVTHGNAGSSFSVVSFPEDGQKIQILNMKYLGFKYWKFASNLTNVHDIETKWLTQIAWELCPTDKAADMF